MFRTVDGNKIKVWQEVTGEQWDKLTEGKRAIITEKDGSAKLVKLVHIEPYNA